MHKAGQPKAKVGKYLCECAVIVQGRQGESRQAKQARPGHKTCDGPGRCLLTGEPPRWRERQ
eukprot:9586238-Prorocentrum_lima.AAC.1